MCFYSVDTSSAAIVEYKRLVNLMLIEPLVEDLKKITGRIILFGSCARGSDTSRSDFDLFIVTNNRADAAAAVSEFSLPQSYEGLRIQPVIKTPVELLQAGESERAFIDEVERGIVLWEGVAREPRV